ncbi:hypothetical protein PtA15_6A825 [Puccinia triticina]|uniref:Uncharacterized protein n=1 Tax=Puccinia triticina TaxID=208348 RepID=A0ABY7CMP2_9BASI|nr:uncharacterized protein PtA15_6A825 [Puccinia triticina]WAQ86193.1 hypothetical protein PtA15_6A825 [Puccinia triticina]
MIHLSFFQTTTKGELLKMGFPLGTSRLLCDGVANLHQHLLEVPAVTPKNHGINNGRASTSKKTSSDYVSSLQHLPHHCTPRK